MLHHDHVAFRLLRNLPEAYISQLIHKVFEATSVHHIELDEVVIEHCHVSLDAQPTIGTPTEQPSIQVVLNSTNCLP